MRKVRSDAKSIPLELARWMYWFEGMSLREIASHFLIHHSNLLRKFVKYGIPIRTKRDSLLISKRVFKYGSESHSCKKGKFTDKRGYVHIRHERTYRYLHRVIAENVLGRKLKRNESVHHIDGNRSNNANSNLLICSAKYHHWLHAKMQNFQIGRNHKY